MNRLKTIISAASLLALAVVGLPLSARALAIPSDVEQYLLGVAKFTPAEIASLEGGTVIAKVTPGGVEGEVVAVAAVKIQAARKQVVAYYGQMISYVDGAVTKGFAASATRRCWLTCSGCRLMRLTSRISSRASRVTATCASVGRP